MSGEKTYLQSTNDRRKEKHYSSTSVRIRYPDGRGYSRCSERSAGVIKEIME